MSIRLDAEDLAFLDLVIRKGNPHQQAAARQRLADLERLDSIADGDVRLHAGHDPVKAARDAMVQRHREAWRQPATKIVETRGSARRQPVAPKLDTTDTRPGESTIDAARRAMVERNQNAWRRG